MIFSSSHDHGPALSFFHTATITGQFYHFLKQPRSRVCVIIFFILPRSRASFIIYPSSHEHGPALSFYTATITGQFYHFLKQPRSRACVIIFSYCHDHGPVLSFSQAATITGLRYHFFYTATITGQFYHLPKQPRTRACVIILYCHDHGPVLSFPQAATITGLRYNFFFFYTASITGQISHFLMLPRSRASVSFSSSHDHGPAL